MRLAAFRLTRRRAVRAVAGLVAAFLFTGNVLAAAGLCAAKAPESRPQSHAAAQQVAAHPCAEHVAGDLKPGAPASNHHCPTDDPSAQSRTVDVPASQAMPAVAALFVDWTSAVHGTPPVAVSDPLFEPRPLYARLQRLRL